MKPDARNRRLESRESRKNGLGFGMIEVLVALVVISIGLLGVAKLNALSIGNSRVSGSRSLAAVYLGSLSSAMHANGAYWQATRTAALNVTVNGTTVAGETALGGSYDCGYSSSNPTPTCPTPADVAAYDLRTWGTSLTQLPGGNGAVSCTAATPITCTITITWTEKYIAANASSATGAANQTATPTIVAVVQP